MRSSERLSERLYMECSIVLRHAPSSSPLLSPLSLLISFPLSLGLCQRPSLAVAGLMCTKKERESMGSRRRSQREDLRMHVATPV